MKFEQTHRYSIDFESPWITASAFFAGIGILGRVLYFFIFSDITQAGFGEITFSLVLPLLWLFGFVALLRGVQLNAPFIFGIFVAVYCLLMINWGFQYGSALKGILSLLWYLVLGAGTMITVMGYFHGQYYLAGAFGLSFVLQTLIVDLPRYILTLDLAGYMLPLAMIAGVASLSFFFLALKKRPL